MDGPGEKSVIGCLPELCLSEHMSDVYFTFGGASEKLPAHRLVLSMRSPVFKAMLNGPLSVGSSPDIAIEDSDIDTFRLFLRFIYTDYVCLDESSVLQLLYLANKYCLDTLVEKCSNFLHTNIANNNACVIYEHAKLYDMHDLKRKCFRHIVTHGKDILSSSGFLDISRDTLDDILAENNLQVDEKTIFNAVCSWGKEQYKRVNSTESVDNLRTRLKDTFYRIRFPLIPMETFIQQVCPCKILTLEEESQLLKYMVTGECCGETVAGFSTTVRGRTLQAVHLGYIKEQRLRKLWRKYKRKNALEELHNVYSESLQSNQLVPYSINCLMSHNISDKVQQHRRRYSLEYSFNTEVFISTPFCLKLTSILLNSSNDVTYVGQTTEKRKLLTFASYTAFRNSLEFDTPIILYSGVKNKIIIKHSKPHIEAVRMRTVLSSQYDVQIQYNTDAVEKLAISL